jgi:hypothetical protein
MSESLLDMGKRIMEANAQLDRKSSYAEDYCERIMEMIADFESELDDTQEVGMRLVSFGQSVTFHVQDIGYYNPYLIRFYGQLEDGSPVELIQHVSQISFLLMAAKKLDPEKPARRIGFNVEEAE